MVVLVTFIIHILNSSALHFPCIFKDESASDPNRHENLERSKHLKLEHRVWIPVVIPSHWICSSHEPHPLLSSLKMPAQAQGSLSTLGAKDNNEKRGSRSNLANIGIRVQERKNSRQAIEQQVWFFF